jgi:hypothetical protein
MSDGIIYQELTIIEAMRRVKIIEKRIQTNIGNIEEYSSKPSNQKYLLETEREQREKVKSLAQANEDLMREYAMIHGMINYTNMVTKVMVNSQEYSIHELLLIKRKLADLAVTTYRAMNDRTAETKMARIGREDVTIERLYDETFKTSKLQSWMELKEVIDGRLEVVNATTKIVALPNA